MIKYTFLLDDDGDIVLSKYVGGVRREWGPWEWCAYPRDPKEVAVPDTYVLILFREALYDTL